MDLNYRRPATGAANGLLQYQIGSGSFVDIQSLNFSVSATTGGSIPTIDLSSFTDLQNVKSDKTITFRIVLYNSTASGSGAGPWYVFDRLQDSDFKISGIVKTETLGVSTANTSKIVLVKNTLVKNEIVFGANASVKIYNTAGQLVKTARVSENESLNVSSLRTGIYVVEGNVNGQMVSQKIIKN
ncbi:MAG: T9SS type A sorting domain-containing protein [Flavobacteriaceae bacterium]|nr:T9SS type A sorting domain-containing protein [Flavobacteriaceae bacterium]